MLALFSQTYAQILNPLCNHVIAILEICSYTRSLGQINLYQVVCALLSVFAIFWNCQFAQLPCKYSDTVWSPLDNSSIAWLHSKSLLHSFVPYCTVFYCPLLCCLGLNYTALNLTVLDCTGLHIMHCTLLYSTLVHSSSVWLWTVLSLSQRSCFYP